MRLCFARSALEWCMFWISWQGSQQTCSAANDEIRNRSVATVCNQKTFHRELSSEKRGSLYSARYLAAYFPLTLPFRQDKSCSGRHSSGCFAFAIAIFLILFFIRFRFAPTSSHGVSGSSIIDSWRMTTTMPESVTWKRFLSASVSYPISVCSGRLTCRSIIARRIRECRPIFT
jgi:hypothetical protein